MSRDYLGVDEQDRARSIMPTLSERVANLEKLVLREEIEKSLHAAQSPAAQALSGWDQPPESPTAFEDVIAHIQSSTDRVMGNVHNLEDVANRVMGNLPEGEGVNMTMGASAVPDGSLDHTYTAFGFLEQAITRLHNVTIRFERL